MSSVGWLQIEEKSSTAYVMNIPLVSDEFASTYDRPAGVSDKKQLVDNKDVEFPNLDVTHDYE